MSHATHLLIIALAIVGMEVDIVSNPFSPNFVLSQIFDLLSPDATGADPLETSPADPDSSPANGLGGSEADRGLTVDETVAIRTRARHGVPPRWSLTSALSPLPPAPVGRALSHYHPPAPRLLAPPQLCRFRC